MRRRLAAGKVVTSDGWVVGPWKLGRFCFVLSRDDLWVGVYWDRVDGVLYVAPLPALIFGFRVRPRARQR